jgi:hypothetical protein
MEIYFGALEPSMLRRVHAAAWRPREAGGANAFIDSVMPAVSRMYLRSLPLRVFLPSIWLIGVACMFLAAFDLFHNGSTEEWAACAANALTLPVIVCIGSSLNAKTVRRLLTEFQTLYVLFNAFGFSCLLVFLFRDHPAKLLAFGQLIPSSLLAGFLDAYVETGRLLNSRIFFTLNIVSLLIYLALVSFKLGAFTDYTFEVSTFAFLASSMVCSTMTTLLVFGCKNLGLSFYRPGSLVVLTSSVCCLYIDADTLAVLKAVYSLQGQSLGKHAPNKTVQMRLDVHRASIIAAGGALMVADKEWLAETQQDNELHVLQASSNCNRVVEELAPDGFEDDADAIQVPSRGDGCAPFDLRP